MPTKTLPWSAHVVLMEVSSCYKTFLCPAQLQASPKDLSHILIEHKPINVLTITTKSTQIDMPSKRDGHKPASKVPFRMNTRRTNRNTPDPTPALPTLDRSFADHPERNKRSQRSSDETKLASDKTDKRLKDHNKKTDATRHPMQHRVPSPQTSPSKLTPSGNDNASRQSFTRKAAGQSAAIVTSRSEGQSLRLANEFLSRTPRRQHSPQLPLGTSGKGRALPQDFLLIPTSSKTDKQNSLKIPALKSAHGKTVNEGKIYDSTSADLAESSQPFGEPSVPSAQSNDPLIGDGLKSAPSGNIDTQTDIRHPGRKNRKRDKAASRPEEGPSRKVAKTLHTTAVASQMNNSERAASHRGIELQKNAGSARQDHSAEGAEMTDVQSSQQDGGPGLALRLTIPRSGSTLESTDTQAGLGIRYLGVTPRHARPSSTFQGQYQVVRPFPPSQPRRQQQISTPPNLALPMDTSGLPSRGLYYLDTQRRSADKRKQLQPQQGTPLQRNELQSAVHIIDHPSVRASPTTRAALWQALASGDPFMMSVAQKRRADELTAALTAMNSRQQQERTATAPRDITPSRRGIPANMVNNNASV